VGGRGPEILMYSLLQIGRSYRERADTPMLLLADFVCSEDVCPAQKARVEWVRLVEKAQNFTVTCRVQWNTVLTQKLKSVVIFL
jgi:hypothetical protein